MINMNDTLMTVGEVSQILQMDKQNVRLLIADGTFDFGLCVKLPNSKRAKYIIFREKFNDFIGKGGDHVG